MESDTKAAVRVQANQMLARGEIVRRFCENCGEPDAEMHHPDYHYPDRVKWLCRLCHRRLHALQDRYPSR